MYFIVQQHINHTKVKYTLAVSNNMKKNISVTVFSWLLIISISIFMSAANQVDNLQRLMKSKRSKNLPLMSNSWEELESLANNEHYMEAQVGLKEADRIVSLPGQPVEGVDFEQFAGYVTVDPPAGRALFYYFVESPQNSSLNPLVLWLNGGPGCSSLGYGAMSELGPFRVTKDGRTLFRNKYAWNNVANVIFLESPAGVGFSYSNTSDYSRNGDIVTAEDAYTFLVNWLERFPKYKTRDFYITGESYAGHYVPQLAYTILLKNKNNKQTFINLKGIAIGNAWIDDATSGRGQYDYFWTHALISDETHEGIVTYCDFVNENNDTKECDQFLDKASDEIGDIDIFNIYAPICTNPTLNNYSTTGSVHEFDPCTDYYVEAYLNNPEVQKAMHTKLGTKWSGCTHFNWTNSPPTILPIIKNLIANGIRLWVYSGDTDGRVPVTSSRYSINSLKLPIKTAWHPWYCNDQVGGYVVAYEGLALVTVRGAGHVVPSYQSERALTLISSFLKGVLPPPKP